MTHKTSNVTIRPPAAADADSLAVLSTQLGYPVTTAQIMERLEKIEQERDHQVFVAELSGQVVGWVEVYARTILVDDGVAEIEGLVVDDDARGRGIGQVMMAFVESWAREHGCSHVYLRSNVVREAAHRFYEGLGYHHIKTQKAFLKKL
jgi:GNAT superfamily N-acetyltransferase